MNVAKPEAAKDPSQEWLGPRVVLLRTRDGAGVEDLRASVRSAVEICFDGVELVARGHTEGVLAHLAAFAASDFADNVRTAVAAALHTTDLEAAIHDATELLNHAADVHATCLSLTLPPLRGAGRTTDDEPAGAAFARYQDQLNFAFRLLHRARFAAERSGVALAVEGASGGGLRSPVELRELLDEANSASVGMCLDAPRVAEHGCPLDWFETLRHRVHAIRLSGQWTSDAMIGAIRRCGFDRTVILDGPEALEAVRRVLTDAT